MGLSCGGIYDSGIEFYCHKMAANGTRSASQLHFLRSTATDGPTTPYGKCKAVTRAGVGQEREEWGAGRTQEEVDLI